MTKMFQKTEIRKFDTIFLGFTIVRRSLEKNPMSQKVN